MREESKSLFLSKTFWGLALILLGHFLPDAAPLLKDTAFRDLLTLEIIDLVSKLIEVIGSTSVLLGRITAKQTVHLKKPNGQNIHNS